MLAPASRINVAHSFLDLCETLAGSLIGEDRPISLRVDADSASVLSRDAVSIGLIVTELVMNALKHAFREEKLGASITVSYKFAESDWKLTVSDNGSGNPPIQSLVGNPRLGGRLIELLAKQLDAQVERTAGPSGLRVCVTHTDAYGFALHAGARPSSGIDGLHTIEAREQIDDHGRIDAKPPLGVTSLRKPRN